MWKHASMHTYTYTYTQTYTDRHTDRRTHARTHAHTHTHMRWCSIEQVCQGVKCKALWTLRIASCTTYSVYDLSLLCLQNLFSIERISGIVRVNHTLNRDKAAVVSSTVKTVDTSGPGQSATGNNHISLYPTNPHPGFIPLTFSWGQKPDFGL